MFKTYLRKHSKLLIYLIGLLLLSTLLYFAILRHEGYIFYWDLSGAFDFRDSFGQYFRMYTPWDGISLGVKNRIPLVSLIYLIYLPFRWLGFNNYVVIKIAIVLLFVGAYTTFYFLFPRLLSIFRKGKYVERNIHVWALILGLLYTFIPFYTYRISQLHLFYMSIFYPLQVYFFLRILNCKRIEKRTILLFVITMFFGLTSPNLIFFNLVTFAILFIIFLISNKFVWEKIKNTVYSLIIAFCGSLLVNLYWIVPYIMMGSPTPGYVVNSSMVEMLSQGISPFNFILGQAEWFVGQGDLGVLDHLTPSIVVVQIIGIVVFYVLAIYGLFKYVLNKYRYFVLVILALTAFLVLDFMPFQSTVFSFIVFSPIGWAFREINRVSFLWYFWLYLMFSFGIYKLYISILSKKTISKFLKLLYVPMTVIPFFVYLLPVNVKIFQYLKPIEIDSTIQEVYDFLEEDNDFFSVLYFPRVDPYKIPWMNEKFDIADSEEYKWLTYNSPKPSIYIDSVIPNAKTYQTLLTEYLYQERDKFFNIGGLLDNAGVKYVVVRKSAEPITLSRDYVRAEIIYPMYLYLEGANDFDLVLENEYYALFHNNSFTSIAKNQENTVYSVSSFNIMEHLPPSVTNDFNIRFCNFTQTWETCFKDEGYGKIFLKYQGEEYPFLSLLSYEEKIEYGYYLYDATFEHGIDVDWGRASFYDRINGEFRNVLRKYDIHSWDFDIVDKVAYSDRPFVSLVEKEEEHSSSITLSSQSNCQGECIVYANVLFSHIGGELEINVNEISETLFTKSDFEVFKWIELGSLELNEGQSVEISVENKDAFAALGGILIVPTRKVDSLQAKFSRFIVINVPYEGLLDQRHWGVYRNDCEFEVSSFEGDVVTVVPNKSCEDMDSLYLTNFNSDFRIQSAQESGYKVLLSSHMDYQVMSYFILTLVFLFALSLAVFLF